MDLPTIPQFPPDKLAALSELVDIVKRAEAIVLNDVDRGLLSQALEILCCLQSPEIGLCWWQKDDGYTNRPRGDIWGVTTQRPDGTADCKVFVSNGTYRFRLKDVSIPRPG